MLKFHGLGSILVCILLLSLRAEGTQAFEFKNISFPENEDIEGTSCTLVGCRTSTKFLFTICVGALYMENPTCDTQEIIHSEEVKRVVIHFLFHKVNAKAISQDLRTGFKNNGWPSSSAIADEISRFTGYVAEPMRKNDRVVITYIPGRGTEVRVKDSVKGVIEGQEFMTALFTIWFQDRKKESIVLTREMKERMKESRQQQTPD
ncbi:MAG: chalcone isomerase family protein [Candidatus Latescibacterota bacterium]